MCGLLVENTTAAQIKLIRKYLKLKLIEDNVTFRGHGEEKQHIYDLFKRTVVYGESHSALMIGPRGCGKTTLIEAVLHEIGQEVDLDSDAIVVRLNGVIHHDDKLSLKSITAQMQLENAVGDRVFGTFAENLAFLLSCLRSAVDRRCKSMLFILEEFDMFCHTGRTQTLLYNLFDITHSQQAPMCVLGVTNRIDVMELLEKRVKSRFSHRHLLIFPNEGNGSKTPVDIYRDMLIEMLSMPIMKQTSKGRSRSRTNTMNQDVMDIDQPAHLPEVILQRCNMDTKQFALDPGFVQDWNCHIKALASDDRVISSIEKYCYYTINEQVFRNVLFELVSKLSPSKPYIEAADLTAIIDKTVAPEHRVKLLQSLSILELSLVIAMKHGMDIFDGQPMNFEMVLHRYTKFANANSSTQTAPRPVILKAFEHLQELEIIMPMRSTDSIHSSAETTAGRVQKEYKLYTLAVPNEDLSEAVKNFKALPTEICHWYNNSVV